MTKPMQLLDTHTFCGKSFVYGMDGKILNFKLDDFRRIQEENSGYDIRFLIIPSNPEQNQDIARVVGENRDLFGGAYLHIVPVKNPFLKQTPLSEIEKLLDSKEIIGAKILPPLYGRGLDDPVLDDYVRLLTEKGVPLLTHCSASGNGYSSPKQKLELIEKHPEQKIILAHLGGLNFDSIKNAVSLAETYENLYLNTTGVSGELKRVDLDNKNKRSHICNHEINHELRSNAEELILNIYQRIPDKLLFGTDSPFLEYDIHPFDKLPIEILQKINDNGIKLFRRL